MKKEKIIYSIIGLIVIAGIVFYAVQRRNRAVPPTEIIPEDTTPVVQEKPSTAPVSGQSTQDLTVKFNTSIKSAQTEFSTGNYTKALEYYKQALTYKKSDVVYAGMYVVYSAQQDWTNALKALNNAIAIKPTSADYWNWKMLILDEKTQTSFEDIKKVYNEALKKVDGKLKINIVTTFARITENNMRMQEAISLWKYAITLNPANTTIYQGEVDRLSTLQ